MHRLDKRIGNGRYSGSTAVYWYRYARRFNVGLEQSKFVLAGPGVG